MRYAILLHSVNVEGKKRGPEAAFYDVLEKLVYKPKVETTPYVDRAAQNSSGKDSDEQGS